MDEAEIRHLIYRLTSGYTFIGDYIIDTPNSELLAQGDNIYRQFMHENRFEDMIDESRTEFILMKNGLWSAFDTSSLQSLPKALDEAKLELYHAFAVPSRQARIRTQIKTIREKYNELMSRKHMYDHYTIEYLADEIRDRFIFSKIILNKKFKRIRLRPLTIDKIIRQYKINAITLNLYRKIAKDNQWNTMWDAGGLSNFRVIGEEQRYLIGYTKLYDSIKKNPDAPNDIIINDDDMLDGWMIHVKREQEQEKKGKDYAKTTKDKGNEHFIMAKTPEDVQSILEMNDTRGRVIQQKLHNMVKQDGVANEYNIQEIRQESKIKRM